MGQSEGFQVPDESGLPWFQPREYKELAKILISCPTSGLRDAFGDSIIRGSELALVEMDPRRLSFMWALCEIDDMNFPEVGDEIAHYAVNDRDIVAVIGPSGSRVALREAPTLEQAWLPFFPLALHPDLTNQGWDNVFRLEVSGEVQVAAMSSFLSRRLGKRRVAVIYEHSMGSLCREFVRLSESAGIEVVAQAGTRIGELQYPKILNDIAPRKPDAFVVLLDYPDGIELIRYIRKAEFPDDIAIVCGSDMFAVPTAKRGKASTEGVYAVAPGGNVLAEPDAVKFDEEYRLAYQDYEPERHSVFAYDAVRIIVRAVESAGAKDRRTVLDTIKAIEAYQGISGDISFDDAGNNILGSLGVYRVHDSKWEYVEDL